MQRKTALVIGCGMAGLLAARALSDHFEKVIAVDRDDLPDDHTWRNGVPQAHHTHVLLDRGARILERYFPGFQNDLQKAGAPAFDFGRDLRFCTYYGWAIRPFGKFPGHRCTRSLLEACVRKRVRQVPNIEFRAKAAAKGLITRNEAVVGIDTSHGPIEADLVVEASGKASKMAQWVTSLGYTFPRPAVIDGKVGYATQIFKSVPREPNQDWTGLYIQGAPGKPDGRRGGSLFPIENGKFQVTVAGVGGDHPPVEHDDFLEYVRAFRVPHLYNVIRSAEPEGQMFGSRSTENRHLHLERATRWPQGFLVTGDAAIHLNPVYAQGMTLAAIESEALDLALRGGDDAGLAKRFYKAINRGTQAAWMLSTNMDLRVPDREGDPAPPFFSVVTFYMDQLMKLVPYYKPAAYRFAEVLHLLRSPNSLVAPQILVAALAADAFGESKRHELQQTTA